MGEDIQQQILDELRNQTAMFRKVSRLNIVFMCIFVAVVAISMALTPLIHRISRSSSTSLQRNDSWHQVRSLCDQGESVKANEMLGRLIKKDPDYWYGYALLGSIYQELGKSKEAEEAYAKAYGLFPSEDNKKILEAIRTVLSNEASAKK